MRTLKFFKYILIFATVINSKYDKKKIIERLEVKLKFANKKLSQKLGQKSGQKSKV